MTKRKGRRSFSAEYKADVVRLCRAGDRSIGEVARDLGLTETSVRAWVQQATVGAGGGDTGLGGRDHRDSSAIGAAVWQSADPSGAARARPARLAQAGGARDARTGVARAAPAPVGAHDGAGSDAAGRGEHARPRL